MTVTLLLHKSDRVLWYADIQRVTSDGYWLSLFSAGLTTCLQRRLTHVAEIRLEP